jgi:GR25 family glycosyltransferase involved in LPS biosynthesis
MEINISSLDPCFSLYIVHYHLLTERLEYLTTKLGKLERYKIICIERDYPEQIGIHYRGIDVGKWISKCKYLYPSFPRPRSLVRPEIACASTHFLAWEFHCASNDKEWALVIEDDATWDGDFLTRAHEALENAPSIADAVFLGGGFPHESVSTTIGATPPYFLKKHPATNTVVGYALRTRILANLLNCCDEFTLPIDWELAYRLYFVNSVVFHHIPYLVQEGSKSIYNSNVEKLR